MCSITAAPQDGIMARLVYCKKCDVGYASVGGDYPKFCPACEQPAFWTTTVPRRKHFRLSENDRKFLRSLRIEPTD